MTQYDISVHSPVAKPLIDLVAVRQLHVARLFPVAEAGSACLVHLFPARVERQTLTARFQMCRAINTRFLMQLTKPLALARCAANKSLTCGKTSPAGPYTRLLYSAVTQNGMNVSGTVSQHVVVRGVSPG